MPSYYYSCTTLRCTLHVEKIGDKKAQAVADAYAGKADGDFLAAVDKVMGGPQHVSNVRRHAARHLHLIVEASETAEKVGDMEILDVIIKKGFQHSASWRPTISDTMKAMEMKLKLGGENPFQAMFDMMDSALDMADENDPGYAETPEALANPDELGEDEEAA